ncbi:MAG: hypothetical protein IPH07_13845 [Deltaproteobacteria bacterium]|nr:hypothetical protein [Deltaproteobacteria bacterium]
MVALAPLVAAMVLLAPPATTAGPTAAGRPYDGTRAVTMRGDAATDPIVRGTTPDADPNADPDAAIDATDHGAAIATPDPTIITPEPRHGIEPTPKPTPVPRILTTMSGWYPGEQAKVTNEAGTVTFIPDLQLRAVVGSVSEFSLDDDGSRYDEGAQLFGRVRWRPQLVLGKRQNLTLVGMVDLANGRWAPTRSGNPIIQELLDHGHPPQSYGMYIADLRELYVQWTSKYGQLRVGQMAFNWGLGLISNDGNNMDRFGDMKFGDDGVGSINERILFATKPFARGGGAGKDVIVALAGDLVYRDPQADLAKGDLAGQVILAVRWEPSDRPGNTIGAYGAYRRQRSKSDGDSIEGDDDLEVGVFDLAGQGFRNLRESFAVLGGFEVVGVAGRTSFAKGAFDRHQVLQAAAALRGYVGNPARWLLGADAGLATGDANPDDDQVNDFKAAPGYTAGLLLFQYYRGWQTARTEIRAQDPSLAGVPPNGTQYLPSKGSVTNALYLQPKFRYALREIFELWGGPLVATAAVPLVDPYTTKLRGGSPHNSLGGDSSQRYLGTELDLGLRARYGIRGLWLQAGLQGGVLFPGRAFADANGRKDRPVYGGFFRAELRY